MTIKNNKITFLVTGGSGFLGNKLSNHLSSKGYKVIIYDKLKPKKINLNQEYIKGDLIKTNNLKTIINKIDYVYHFAGMADIEESNSNPLECIKNNILGTSNILDLLSNSKKLKRFIFASSIYIYSQKGGFYKISKLCCEKIIEEYSKTKKINFSILRFGSIYGPGANKFNWINNILKDAIKNKKIIRYGDGNEIRNYIHINDAVNLCFKVINEEKYKNDFIIIKGIDQIKIKDLLTMISEIFNNEIKIIYKKKKNSDHYEITPYSYNEKVAKQIIPEDFVDLGEGLLDCIKYIKNN